MKRILFAVLVTLPFFSLSAAAETLPGSINDKDFWQMVSGFSEADGAFDLGNSNNVIGNEAQYQSVMPALMQAAKAGGAYLGVGPEQNFTYIAALKPKIAFIIDIRRENMIELLMYKALFDLSSDRADFVSRLFSRKIPPQLRTMTGPPRTPNLPVGLNASSTAEDLLFDIARLAPDTAYFNQNFQQIKDYLVKTRTFPLTTEELEAMHVMYSAFYFAGPNLDFMLGTIDTNGRNDTMPTYKFLMTAKDASGVQRSFLASEANFKFVQDLEKHNLIVPLVGDFAGAKAIPAIAQYLKTHDTLVSAFYVSNVEQYLFPDKVARFYSNVEALPLDSSSTFIRAANQRTPVGLFVSMLSPINDVLAAFKVGQLKVFADVVRMSK